MKMERFNEIRTPEAWRTAAKALWEEPKPARCARRFIRPALVAAVVACLLIGTAAAVYVVREHRNAIIVADEEEMRTVLADMEEERNGRREHSTYSVSAPGPEQLSPATYRESATHMADHWLDEVYVSSTLLATKGRQDWTFAGYDVSEGSLWKRHAVTSDGWYKAQYTAETVADLNGADPGSVLFTADTEALGFALIPWGDRLEIVKDGHGRLLGMTCELCWMDGEDRYFQMEYSYEANAVDWGTEYVLRDLWDDVAAYTTADGREFILKTAGDRLWAESVTPNESYYCYGIGLDIPAAEALLEQACVTVLPG